MKIRDKETLILFVLGFGLTIFIMINGYNLINLWYGHFVNNSNQYKNLITYDGNFDAPDESFTTLDEYNSYVETAADKVEAVFEILSERPVTVYMNSWVRVTGINDGARADIVFSYAEKWPEKLKSGRCPEVSEIKKGKRMALVGEAFLGAVFEIDGTKYIEVDKEMYEVAGVLESYQIGSDDESMVIFYPHTEKNGILEQQMEEAGLFRARYISIGSNKEDVSAEGEKVLEELQKLEMGNFEYVYNREDEYFDNEIDYQTKMFMLVVMYVISIVNCILISGFWANKRRHEFVIMKTYGMSNNKILIKALTELVTYIGITFLVVMVLDVVYVLLFAGKYDLLYFDIHSIKIFLIAALVMIVMSIIPVDKVVSKCNPAKELKEL